MLNLAAPVMTSILAVALLLLGETRGIRALVWIAKPTASCCFLWLALQAGAADSSYGRWLLAGLVACMAGDIFLIPKAQASFLAGLSSFLLGHLLYGIAFMQLQGSVTDILLGAMPALVLGVGSLYWLRPHLPQQMRIPVFAYISVICLMLSLAAGSMGGPAAAWILAGAWGFAISDLSVAREQFVHSAAINRLWGLPLYFGSQMLLAWTPALF